MANITSDGKTCIEREITIKDNLKDVDDNIVRQFEIQATCDWITAQNYEKVCLQFPDDLLPVSAKIYEEIKNRTDVDLYILGDTSYASCCVDSVAARHVQAEAIIHYGRSCFSKYDIPTFTVLPKKELDIDTTLRNIRNRFESDDERRLCLFYDADYEYCKEEISRLWHTFYPRSLISYVELEDAPLRFMGRVIRDAQGGEQGVEVLRDCTCIYLGSRGQTAFNYAICIQAIEWHILDPETNTIEPMNETNWLKRRRFMVEKCKDAKTVGILVCKLSGDQTKDIISRMKQLCKASGKKSYIVSVGKPNVAKLANFPEIEIYVLIACPESELYNCRDFYQPVVYPFELEVALNANRAQYFTNHITDFDDLLPGKRFYCDIKASEGTDVSLITGKIRETKLETCEVSGSELVVKENWALENIGRGLQDRSWSGLEQNLGETEVKKAEEGRKGIPLQYQNEPE